eukprot:3031638-Amphidinium_carterae.1
MMLTSILNLGRHHPSVAFLHQWNVGSSPLSARASVRTAQKGRTRHGREDVRAHLDGEAVPALER